MLNHKYKIEFNEEKHEYKVNGIVKPSVTQIISNLHNCDWFTEESRIRGKNVHKICEYMDEGIIDYKSIDHSYIGFITAYESFLEQVKPMWYFVEKILYNATYDYIGTVDRIGKIFSKDAIVDIKTGSPHPSHGVQISAYKEGFYSTSNLKRYGLYLTLDGKYKLIEYKDFNDFKIFKSCLSVHNWKILKGVKNG